MKTAQLLKEASVIMFTAVVATACVAVKEKSQEKKASPKYGTLTYEEWIDTVPMPVNKIIPDPLDEIPQAYIIREIEHTERDVKCLQQNVYHEARGESTEAQRDIAWVTLNRVELPYYGDSICDVVWQPHQFSWTSYENDGVPHFPNDIERKAWHKAGDIARQVVTNYMLGLPDPTDGADHYHAEYVNPNWADGSKVVAFSGQHIFYRLH